MSKIQVKYFGLAVDFLQNDLLLSNKAVSTVAH